MATTSTTNGFGDLTGYGNKSSAIAPTRKITPVTTTAPTSVPFGQSILGSTPTAPNNGSRPEGYDQLVSLFQSLLPSAGPAIAGANATINNQQGLLGQLLANQSYQGGLLQQSGDISNQRLGIQDQQFGNSQEQLQRQMALFPQQKALQDQLYGLNQEAINSNRATLGQSKQLTEEDLQANRAGLTFRNNLSTQELNQNQNQTIDAATRSAQDARDNAAARGAGMTVGARRDQNDITTQLANSMASIGRQREGQSFGFNEALAGLDRTQRGNDITYNERLGDLGRSERQQGINQQQFELNSKEQQAQLQDQQKALDLVAKSHGLDRQEVENRTNTALAQLGLNTVLSSGQIHQSIINAQNGKMDALTPILSTIYQYIGLRPQAGS